MRGATWHNFNVILLNCGMNIQIRNIQDKSSYCHRNNNTSSILTKKSCLLKITWPKKVIPTKSYSLAMLYLHHTKYLIMHNPYDKPSNRFILLMCSNFFNLHAIHEREPWTQHYRWNRMEVVEKTKIGDSLTSTRRIDGLWRCPSIDINVSEQGL